MREGPAVQSDTQTGTPVVVDPGALDPMRCPCGWARRAFADVPDAPASVLLVEIEADARAHDHREHTGIDVSALPNHPWRGW